MNPSSVNSGYQERAKEGGREEMINRKLKNYFQLMFLALVRNGAFWGKRLKFSIYY